MTRAIPRRRHPGTLIATILLENRMPPKRHNIVLVSGSKLFLDGLRKIIEFEAEIDVAAEIPGGKDIVKCIGEIAPDFIFIDNREYEYDLEKIARSREFKAGRTRIISFTQAETGGPENDRIIKVNFETTTSELMNIIKNGGDGKPHPASASLKELEGRRITKTEFKIIQLIAAGESNREIAAKLSISEKTVKAHITSIFEKLNLHNRYQLMVYGKRNKKNMDLEI